MLLLFFAAVLLFFASLLPVFYPGTIVSMFGVPLNSALAEFLATRLRAAVGPLVSVTKAGSYALTLEGVLAVYLPVLGIFYLLRRGH